MHWHLARRMDNVDAQNMQMSTTGATMFAAPVQFVHLLILCATFTDSQQAPPRITGISHVQGSLLGGQRLAIYGSGFSVDTYTGGNEIWFGSESRSLWPYTCTVIEGACTVDCGSSSKIVCETSEIHPKLLDPSWAEFPMGFALDVKVASTSISGAIQVAVFPEIFSPTGVTNSARNPTLLSVEPRQVQSGGIVNLTVAKAGTDIHAYRMIYVGKGRPPLGANLQG